MKYRELLNLFNENVKEDTEIDDILKMLIAIMIIRLIMYKMVYVICLYM